MRDPSGRANAAAPRVAERVVARGRPTRASHAVLRATAIVGGASVANIAIGILRNKAVALLLGPAGVGTIGVLLNLVTAFASVAGLGVAMASVRALASAIDEAARAQVRRTVLELTTLLAVTGGVATWLLAEPIARLGGGALTAGGHMGWLAPAVALTIWSSTQFGLLNGQRRLGDLARAQVAGAALGGAVGIAAVVAFGARGIGGFVVAAPLGMVIVATGYVWRAERAVRGGGAAGRRPRSRRFDPVTGRALIALGLPMMLGGLALPLGLLLIRAVLGDRLGAPALGQFTAAWTLSATYVGFVLAAMGSDYFPRLSAVITDRAVARAMVADQAEVTLLLALPVMLGVQATAPWLVRLLYSDAFAPTVAILRWQIAGDVLKLASWPLTFVVLAQARGRLYWLVETVLMTVMVATVWALVPRLGLVSTGVAYCLAYAIYLPALLVAARRMIGFTPSRRVVAIAALGLSGVAAIGLVAPLSAYGAMLLGLLLAAIGAGLAYRRLR